MALITLGWLHIVALLGAIQGVFLAAILATQHRNRTANRLLAVAMLAFSIYLAADVYYAAGLERVYPHFFGVSYPLPLLFGPLVYLYAVAASDRTHRLRWQDALHFLPFVLVVLACIPIYSMSGEEKIALYGELQRGVVPPLLRVVEPLKFVSGVSYATATLLFLRRHSATVKDSYSSLERVNLQWLFKLAVASAAIWAMATAFEMTQWTTNHPLLDYADDMIALAIAVLVYGTGYMALRQPEIFNFAALDHPTPQSVSPNGTSSVTPAPPPAAAAVMRPDEAARVSEAGTSAPRYERSGLTEREAAALQRALIAAMEEDRLYRDSGLTLADLAERLDTTPHKLSEVLNAQLDQTFYGFVNGYRVRDVQRRIAEEQSKNLTILALAMDAGFASKSTFNHVFRQHTGHTPSAYRRSLTG
jgi:AraC-like DNA-binding protein